MYDECLQAIKEARNAAAAAYKKSKTEYDRGMLNGLETAIAAFESRHPNLTDGEVASESEEGEN